MSTRLRPRRRALAPAVATLLLTLAATPGCKDRKAPAPATGPDGAVAGVLRAPPADEEIEPNDRPEQATPLRPGQALQGRIRHPAGGRDVDHYVLASQAPGGLLRVELSGVPGLDLVVSVLDKATRKVLATANNGGAGAPEVIPNVGLGPGEHLVVVRESGKRRAGVEAPYTLTASVSAAGEGDEREPNDTRPDAQELVPGVPVRGYFGKRKDVDWYRVRLPDNVPESTLRLELTGTASVPFATLRVLDEIEAVLKQGATGRGTGLLFPNVLVKAGQKLLYVVVAGGKRFSTSEAYTLTAALTPRQGAGEEREPNDRPVHATPLTKGQAMRGYLAPAGDEDWYAAEVGAPSLLRASVTGLDGVDLVLSVHDAAGKELLRADAAAAREGEVVPSVYVTGRALLRVSGKKRQENVFQTYEVTADWRPAVPGEEREPNDTAAQANDLALGAEVRGHLYPRRDVDVYRVEVPAAGPAPRAVRFELRGIPKVPLVLTLRDAAGAVVATAGPKAPEEALTLEKPLPPGRYHAEVTGGSESNPRDTYTLRVSAP